jgi:23S rRNA pseudouridine2605 synthase
VRHQSGQQTRDDGTKKVGLARALSKLGYCSRSRAAELAENGRVRLNGVIRRDPEAPVQLSLDRIEVDGGLARPAEKLYVMLNKPRGVVTTASDEAGRETVYASLESLPGGGGRWLAPVGRLDKASEGLLLFTNNTRWAARILSPEAHIAKTYHVQIDHVADQTLLESLRNGVPDAQDFLRVREAEVLRNGERNSWLEIVLDEGKNRHIRRMLQALSIEVLRLVRVSIGPLQLGDLPKGACRKLTRDEVRALGSTLKPETHQGVSLGM